MYTLFHKMKDDLSGSVSLLVEMKVKDYLSIIQSVYDRNGGLVGQRSKLKSTSALRIRDRMISDLKNGAILPPVVIGLLVTEDEIPFVYDWDEKVLQEKVSAGIAERISIIDGMQRTTVFLENIEILGDRSIRVEFWVTTQTASLTYRMLVLNTGQVPWNLRQQIEVIYSSLLTEINQNLQVHHKDIASNISLYRIGEGKRTEAGEFQSNEVIEMYIVFGLKKEKVDTETVLADEFLKLDMIESVSDRGFLRAFMSVFSCLCKIDLALYRIQSSDSTGRFKTGRNLFDSQPACVGFMVAASQKIFGRPGQKKGHEHQGRMIESITEQCDNLVAKINSLAPEEFDEFLAYGVLNDEISKKSKKIGDFEREFFTEAFRVFFTEEEPIYSLEILWRAY